MTQSKRILWIDDEIDLLRAHIKLLEQRGYVVDVATNGEDAVEMTKQRSYERARQKKKAPTEKPSRP